MIFVNRLRLHEGRHLPVIIWLCFLFSSICLGEVSQNFLNLWNLSSRSFKSRKKEGVTKAVFSLLAILCFLPLSQIWCYDFFYQQALGRAQICLTIQQIWTSPRFITNQLISQKLPLSSLFLMPLRSSPPQPSLIAKKGQSCDFKEPTRLFRMLSLYCS